MFMIMKEILSIIDENIFIPYNKSLIELLFSMRNKKDAHSR